jgi:hypothetical protein
MATVIKLKRSEIASTIPTNENLEVGELAINTVDRLFYIKTSGNQIIPVANYVDINPDEIDNRLDALENTLLSIIFPTGDYGNLDELSVDAFGISVSPSYDCLTIPSGAISEVNLGAF